MSKGVTMSQLLQSLRAKKAAAFNRSIASGDSNVDTQEENLDSTLELEEKLKNLKLEDKEEDSCILKQGKKEEVNDNDKKKMDKVQKEDIKLRRERLKAKYLKNDNKMEMAVVTGNEKQEGMVKYPEDDIKLNMEEVNDNIREEKQKVMKVDVVDGIRKPEDPVEKCGKDLQEAEEKKVDMFSKEGQKMSIPANECLERLKKLREEENLTPEDVVEELRQAREKLRRIRNHREMLKELYDEKNKEDSAQSFPDLRDKYVRLFLKEADQQKKLKSASNKLRDLNRSIGNLQWELDSIKRANFSSKHSRIR